MTKLISTKSQGLGAGTKPPFHVCAPPQTREWRPSAPSVTCSMGRAWKGPRSCLYVSIPAVTKTSWTQPGT